MASEGNMSRRGLFKTGTVGAVGFVTGSAAAPVAASAAASVPASGVSFGGWGGADAQAFGDLVSTLPRTALNNAINHFSLQAGFQYLFLIPVTAEFVSTGIRYVTGLTSGITGATVTVTAYTGTTTAALTRVTNPAPAPFTAVSSFTQVAWPSAAQIQPNWLAIVFTCTAVGATPPRLMTPAANNAAGSGFLNPGVGIRMAASRISTALPDMLDVTSGWNPWALPTWLAAY